MGGDRQLKFKNCVMLNEDRIKLAEENSRLGRIEAKLLKNPAWLECKLPKKANNKEQER